MADTTEFTTLRSDGATTRRTAGASPLGAATAPDVSERHGVRSGGPGTERFGRIFPIADLPPLVVDEALFSPLAANMLEPNNDPPIGDAFDNAAIPAGYTYFGQFVDHDVTNDPTPITALLNPPDLPVDTRTPILDLDCLYDAGPMGTSRAKYIGPRFALGVAADGKSDDLPREENGAAFIGDLRNDENLIVSQLHLAIMKFHNKIVDGLLAPFGDGLPTQERLLVVFFEARRIVLAHYRWLVLNDRIARLAGGRDVEAGRAEIERVRRGGRVFAPKRPFALPVEFAGAAYRLGHSMVRFNYRMNDAAPTERDIFDPTGAKPDLQGRRPLPADAVIRWRHFFALAAPSDPGDPNAVALPQASMRLDTSISFGLGLLPFTVPGVDPSDPRNDDRNLAFRNLKRGVHYGLPSGRSLARAYGIPAIDRVRFFARPTQSADGAPYTPGAPIANEPYVSALRDATPLWYYILFEAITLGGGERLGPLGRRIGIEVFLAILEADRTSIAHTRRQPSAGRFGVPADPRKYELGHLVAYATGQPIESGSPLAPGVPGASAD